MITANKRFWLNLSTIRNDQSTLMSKLTGTHSEASEIDFTTLTTVPGTVKVHGAPIQILDLRALVYTFDRAVS